MKIKILAVAVVCGLVALALAPRSRADIIGNTTPGAVIEGRVERLEYDESGQLIVAVIADKKGNLFYVFDGNADNDLQTYGRAFELAFAAGAHVVLGVENNDDVVSVQLRRKKKSVADGDLPIGVPGGGPVEAG